MRFRFRQWAINQLIAWDISWNAFLGGAPDETISSRLGRWKDDASRRGRQRFARVVCWLLDRIDPGHCDGAEANEKRNIHRPESLDDKPGD